MARKLKVIYTPEGASRREWIIDLENPAWDLMFATEKATDWPWAVFSERLMNSSAIALRAFIWVLRKRDETRLQLESVEPDLTEIDFAAQCPDCEEWVTTEDEDEHNCPKPAGDGDEAAGADPSGEA